MKKPSMTIKLNFKDRSSFDSPFFICRWLCYRCCCCCCCCCCCKLGEKVVSGREGEEGRQSDRQRCKDGGGGWYRGGRKTNPFRSITFQALKDFSGPLWTTGEMCAKKGKKKKDKKTVSAVSADLSEKGTNRASRQCSRLQLPTFSCRHKFSPQNASSAFSG